MKPEPQVFFRPNDYKKRTECNLPNAIYCIYLVIIRKIDSQCLGTGGGPTLTMYGLSSICSFIY
jgi:hypothetical protein